MKQQPRGHSYVMAARHISPLCTVETFTEAESVLKLTIVGEEIRLGQS